MSKSKEIDVVNVDKAEIKTPEVVEVAKKLQPSPTVTVLASLGTAKKIGVVRYLQLYPQNFYVEEAMKFEYKSKVYTEEEWHKIAAKVRKKLGIN